MKRNKKVTLKHFVNTRLKTGVGESDRGGHHYPLYLEIIYRRQHIQIKSIIDKTFTEDLQNVNETDQKLMSLELERVKKIIRYDENLFGDDHKLKGIGNRYTNYNAAIYAIVDDGLRFKLKKNVRKYRPELSTVLNFDLSVVPIENLFAAVKALWPDLGDYINLIDFEIELQTWEKYFKIFPRKEVGKFKYPAFIDWMADEHFDKMMKLLNNNNNITENVIERILVNIDETIRLSTIGQ